MLEWMLAAVIGGFIVVIERQVTLGRNQMTILKEVRDLRLALEKRSNAQLQQVNDLMDVISDAGREPEERRHLEAPGGPDG